MEPERFFHVAVKTDDLDASVDFYRELFGGSVVDESAPDEGVQYVALEVADKRVYVFEQAPYEAAGLVDELPTGFLHFGFVVPEVDAAVEELTDAGVELLMEPETFGELRIAFLYDPSGSRVELLEEL
ncbi:VOC family protein [Natronomonas sp.]|uniref:VOC family protein n=1 Tax=Natronomonas sp. TaxID=2184060 RepID=UPI002FC297B2